MNWNEVDFKVRKAKILMETNANKDHHILSRVHGLKVTPCCGDVKYGDFGPKICVVRVPHCHDHGSHLTSHKMLMRWDGNKGGQSWMVPMTRGWPSNLIQARQVHDLLEWMGSSCKLSNLAQMVGLERERGN